MEKYYVKLKEKDICSCGSLLFHAVENEISVDITCIKCGKKKSLHKKTKIKYINRCKLKENPEINEKLILERKREIKKALGIEIAYSSYKICPKCRTYRNGVCLVNNIKVEKNEVCQKYEKLYAIGTMGIKVVQGGKVSPR